MDGNTPKKKKSIWADKRSYKKRLLMALAVLTAVAYTYLFFGPLEMVAFSGGSLVYGYRDVVLPLLLTMAVFLLITVPLTALLRGKVFNCALCLFATVAVAGYLQALLLNGGLGLLTGDGIDWSRHILTMILSALLWLAILAGFLVLMFKRRKLWRKTIAWVCVGLTVMQLVPTAAVFLGFYEQTRTDDISGYRLSDEDFHTLPEGRGIYIFVLDRLDYDYIQRVLKKDPDFFDGLEGFTSYTNAISGYARTQPALVHMLTGQEEQTYRVSEEDYYSQVWQDRNILSDLQEADYSVDLYSNIRNLFSDPEQAAALADNAGDGHAGLNWLTTVRKLLQLSAFRYAPTALKPLFWADTNYYNEDVYISDGYAAYQFDDAAYAAGFARADTEDGNGFKLYHFFGPHAPYTMNADGTKSQTETTVEAQTMGSFVNLMKIFGKMKELGIYDDATILITGDHGAAMYDTKPLVKATRIGLFYKPAGAERTPLQHSSAPVSVTNIPATVAKAAGLDRTPYGTALDEVAEDAQLVRTYYKTVCDSTTYRETQLCIYEVRGDASKFENWTLVETVSIPFSYN